MEVFTQVKKLMNFPPLQGIGCTKITKAEKEGSMSGNPESRSYLEKKLVFCFGSYVAAQLLLPFGEENLLSSSEIKQAQEVGITLLTVKETSKF